MSRSRTSRKSHPARRCSNTSEGTHDIGPTMFSHMFREVSFTDVRRRALTLIDVLAESHTAGPLASHRIAIAVLSAWFYWNYLLPMISSWGTAQYSRRVALDLAPPRVGGPGSDVHWAILVFAVIAYVFVVYFGVRFMERRPPVRKRVFEWMVVYNATQALLNLRLAVALFNEAWRLGYYVPWGNQLDSSEKGHGLGMLIWYSYHYRQLDLLDTLFMIFRKKFQRISLVHVYLRLLNLLGWFVACRFACGGDTIFPALVHAICQVVVYLYYVFHFVRPNGVPFFKRARVAEIQVMQFMACAVHSIMVIVCGNVPPAVTAFNLFIQMNGLMFYFDFDFEHPRLGPRKTIKSKDEGFGNERLTLCFDSCGWLYCYHFGVAQWISEHMLPEGLTCDDAASDKYPKGLAFSGSSGGSLVAGALGSGIEIRKLFEYVMTKHPICRWNPVRLFPALEDALDKFLPENAADSLTGRVRVLLTRVSMKPPFVTGEIVDQYRDRQEAWKTLRASCHVPGLNPKPYKVNDRLYFDGLLWSSFFVPWVSDDSLTVRVSAISRPLTDIRAPVQPLWWTLCPPPEDVLRGLFWVGYRDAAKFFSAPPTPLDVCKCRRLPQSEAEYEADASMDSNRLTKFRAAQKMIIRRSGDMPSVDPVTGQEIEDLIRCYTRAVERRLCLVFVLTLGLMLALLMTVFNQTQFVSL
eukprot:TRINITY_DN79906_c0_g1_i1.p1 TRINITY_DN79906_c0_g1~~TRINITY_DN79906_c0_g1_i1.p1  ORF type:complete len:693 (+),score=49.87 TRINITY_DN79906_c0_g1_i1:52-2130(+)